MDGVLFTLGIFSIAFFHSWLFWLNHNRMVFRRLMDITITSALIFPLLFVSTIGVRYLSGEAIETQPGITAVGGISPVPTQAMGLNGIPKELWKRTIDYFDPPPQTPQRKAPPLI